MEGARGIEPGQDHYIVTTLNVLSSYISPKNELSFWAGHFWATRVVTYITTYIGEKKKEEKNQKSNVTN